MNQALLFKKNTKISYYVSNQKREVNSVLYLYFLENDEITKEKMSLLGVNNNDAKVRFINEGKRFFLEDVGDKYYIFIEEKLPRTKQEIEDYNKKIKPRKFKTVY
jgi:hypothetical protein